VLISCFDGSDAPRLELGRSSEPARIVHLAIGFSELNFGPLAISTDGQ
jgi:hypothetical protein